MGLVIQMQKIQKVGETVLPNWVNASWLLILALGGFTETHRIRLPLSVFSSMHFLEEGHPASWLQTLNIRTDVPWKLLWKLIHFHMGYLLGDEFLHSSQSTFQLVRMCDYSVIYCSLKYIYIYLYYIVFYDDSAA